MPLTPSLRAAGAEIAAFLLAASCSGCERPGTLLCDGCRDLLSPSPRSVRTRGGLTVRAALSLDGVVARCVRRLKGEGDTLLARPLGAALREVLAGPLSEGARAVPVPTGSAAFRRRGYRVPDLLVRGAGAVPLRVLRETGRRADQRGLGARERADNVAGSVRARRPGAGMRVVLVDDVVTTGATLDECARVLDGAGYEVVCAVALAATPRHRDV